MPDLPATSPIDAPDDDALAEHLAARLDELAARCPIAIYLAIQRIEGLLPPHGQPLGQAALAAALGVSRWEVRQLEERGLRKAHRRIRKLLPPTPDNPPSPQP